MLENGARYVTGIDLSDDNISTSKRNANAFGYDNCTFEKSSVIDIPFEDQTFDIVWSNGVLHHTIDPTKALEEVSRVLKNGGWLWLYLYGAGGIDWYTREILFRELKDIDHNTCIEVMTKAGIPTNQTSEFLDACKVPIVENYSEYNVTSKLVELGYRNPYALKHGMDYDTNVLKESYGKDMWGDGDLRYFCQKKTHNQKRSEKLEDLSKRNAVEDRVLFCNRIYRSMRYNSLGGVL